MQILIATAIITAIGLLCGIILVIAARFFKVTVDEKFTDLRNCLPGINCGACGYTGCDSYAVALASDPKVKTNLCIPGSDSVAAQIAEVLGVEAQDVIEQTSRVKCNGNCDNTSKIAEIYGAKSCAAAKLIYGGVGKCSFGCLGFGDCAKVCPTNAICVENGLAHIIPSKCVGCGLCVRTCPNGIISLLNTTPTVTVKCSNHDKGAVARKKCSAACIACKKCEKTCPHDAIKVEDNLAVIDYSKCTNCGECAKVCPTGCIEI